MVQNQLSHGGKVFDFSMLNFTIMTWQKKCWHDIHRVKIEKCKKREHTKVVLSHEEKVELVPSDNLHVLAKLVESEKCKKREIY
jgi:hypothetical protein